MTRAYQCAVSGDGEALKDQLRVLAEHLPFDVWVRDRDDVCIYANAAAREHWPGLVGKRPEDTSFSPEVVATWRSNNDRALAGEVVRGEVAYELAGEQRLMHNVIAPVAVDGRVDGTVGVNIDITSQRNAERALAERDALLRSVFDTTQVVMGVREIRGDDLVHLADNARSAEIFGVTPRDLIGRTDSELGASTKVLASAIEKARRARAFGAAAPFELAYPVSGSMHHFEGTLVPVPRHGTEPDRFFFLAEDVTNRRALEVELLQAERLSALGTLASGVAHEIKNPAAVVLLSLENALAGLSAMNGVSAQHVAEDVRNAIEGTSRIVALVRDMQLLGRPDRPHSERVDVNEVIRSVISLARPSTARAATVTLHPAATREVAASPVRLGQVMLNLLMNAVQAIDEAGGGLGQVEITTSDVGPKVRIDVADTGPGLSEAARARLFQAFATTRSSGTGLGLYLSKRMVDEAGGTLESVPCETGATFRIELPPL